MAGINLVSPSLPPDVQAQLLQQQQLQDIAQGLMAQSLTPGAPTIRTAVGNPFGRDVVNWGNLANPITSALASKTLKNATNAQIQLAQSLMQSRQQEGMDILNSPTMPNGAPSVMGQPPDIRTPQGIRTIVSRALMSTDPYWQGVGKEGMAGLVQALLKQVPTAADAIKLTEGNTPASVAKALAGSTPGMSAFDPTKLDPYQQAIDTSRTAGTLTYAPKVASSATPNPANVTSIPVAPPANPIIAPGATYSDSAGQHTNDTGVPIQQNPVNHLYAPIPEAANLPQAKLANERGVQLQNEFHELVPQVNMIPQLIQVSNLAKRAITGGFSNLRTEAEQAAIALGMTKDEISAVPSTQSLVAMMLPRAAATLRTISPRAAEPIINMVAKASAAGAEGDPRHIVDITGNAIAQIMTEVNAHNNISIPSARQSWLGAGVDQFKVPFPAVTLPADSPISIQKVGNAYINQGITTPRPFAQAGGYQTKTIGDTTYVQRGSKWFTADPQTLTVE